MPQLEVTAPDGRRVRIDDLLGADFAVLCTDEPPPVDAQERAFWDALGTRVVRVDGALAAWLVAHGARAALVRPDRVVLAAGAVTDLPAWRAALRAAGVHGAAPREAGRAAAFRVPPAADASPVRAGAT